MNFRHALAVAILTALISASSGAEAAVIKDYSGPNVFMGATVIGQTGTITDSPSAGLALDIASGTIPANSKITFSYSLAGVTGGALLVNQGSYDYLDGSNHYTGSASSSAPYGATGYSTAAGYINGGSSAPLVFASSNLPSLTSGTTIITNYSAGIASFLTMFSGFMSAGGSVQVSYSITAVPLPAALPLFGLGLAGLIGAGCRRKFSQTA